MARLHCLVPGCKRTLHPEEPDDNAGICAKHWQAIPLSRRKVYRRLRKEQRELRAEFNREFTVSAAVQNRRLCAAIARIWRSLERQAIERSVGI